MINVEQFKTLVLDPTLEQTGLYSIEASELLIGTALAESNLEYLKQIGGGPARGFFQIEPETFGDVFYRYLERKDKSALKKKVYDYLIPAQLPLVQLTTNLPFAVLMARIRYLMVPAAIPKTIEGQAAYWKKYYNTVGGAGTVEKYMKAYERSSA